jgi:hypothetical protein
MFSWPRLALHRETSGRGVGAAPEPGGILVRLTRLTVGASAAMAVTAASVLAAGTVGAKSVGRPDSGTAYVANTPKKGN